MITIKSLTHYIGGRMLYEDVDLQIKPQDKIGLVGLNGTGKSTLFKIIAKQLSPSTGSVHYDKGTTIGFLNQELLSYQTENSIRSVALEAFQEATETQERINAILKQLEIDYSDELVEELSHLQDRFGQLGGYDMEVKADMMLERMGFSTADLERPLNSFSGGWRMRVMFAKLLLQSPSILLLDEPTNHLDIVSIQWVESYLQSYQNAVVIISHDRRFLDATTKKTVEVADQTLYTYAGNYSFYEKEKKLRAVTQQNAYLNQQKQIKKTQIFIDRFRAKSSKARSVQSRIKALDRMEKVPPVVEDKTRLRVQFTVKENPGQKIAEIEGISKSFGELKLFENASSHITRGDKIALIGKNGKGKSTLLQLIVGALALDSGNVTLGEKVEVGFHTQHQLDDLDLKLSVLETIRKTVPNESEARVRSILGAFLFKNDDVHKPIQVLSGGEKARVSLAKTLILAPNFLVLDEPTNHLDMRAIDVLIQALEQCESTLIMVSHNRHFVQGIANKIWYLEEQKIKCYPGSYDEYNYWQEESGKKI